MLFKTNQIFLTIIGVFGAYIVGYGIARINVFHAVEHYPEGKGGPRRDYIAKKDQLPGQGWEYKIFLPAIKLEEALRSRSD